MAVASPVAATVDEQVLDAVAGLMAEVGSGDARRPRLDDLLDRDLGISSLERVELLLRLEQTFGVRLSDTVMADAATPRDLSSAIQQAARASPTAAPLRTHAAPAAAVAVPADARSLADVVRWHAERTPDRVHLWLGDEEGVETAITYGELLVSATAIGRGLRARGVGRGDRVALMLRTERAFFDVFLGSLLVGAIPVPLYPPMRTDDLVAYSQRQRAILDNAGARLLVTFDEAERLGRLLLARTGSLEAVVTPAQIAPAGPPPIFPRPDADDTAFIQYTSGSTGNPKGVVLSHANLLANIRAMGRAVAIDEHDVAVSWLPLYHDMGLIGLWLGALYFGAPTAIMSPLAFLARPARWLRAIHTHRGTISAAPNFAFDLCARAIRDEEIAGLDLRSWRVAIDGSEAVHPDTIDRFVQRFAPFGFSASAFCPAYGLAESSVGLTISPIGRAPRAAACRTGRCACAAVRVVRPAAPGTRRPHRRSLRTPRRRARRRAHSVSRSVDHVGIFSERRGDRGRRARRVDGHRRSRVPRGWRAVHHRPREGPDHSGRAQHLR